MEKDGMKMMVKVTKRETVKAVMPLQEYWLPHSNLDLLLPPLDVSVFFCYTKTVVNPNPDGAMVGAPPTFASMIEALKSSLAQVLVSYYAFAGEVVMNSVSEPETLCNNSGVDFVEAAASFQLRFLDLYDPDESVQGKLLPTKRRGVLAVQATEFECGGIVVACTFDHRVADAYSANMFLLSWAEMCRSSKVTIVPCFRRSLLYPRYQNHCYPHHLGIDQMYVTLSELPPSPPRPSKSMQEPDDGAANSSLISRIYYVTASQLQQLQQLASSGVDRKRTKLEAFSSFLWKMLAKSTSVDSGGVGMLTTVSVGIVVDGRTKLIRADMSSYFGNVLSILIGEENASELVERPLSSVAAALHELLHTAATEEHFLALIDWVEAHRPEASMTRIYSKGTEGGGGGGSLAFVVSSGLRFPMSEIDFGWGRPVFGSYHFPWGGETGYVMPMPSPISNGDWIVYMHLLQPQINFIETEAAHFFRPLNFKYLIHNA
ncbi:hypothetical protein SAY87_001064 [Trapa incisa]|uniref:Uncharacterized protein n=1 Tax=Trapa incisa TaxID=236973 RepID=A0AAN7JHK4_9MYRT|nr:hypothetical protein SAY87_001064 [Trapa incisa]